MKYKTEFSFNKAIVVDANMLSEMNKIILEHCDSIGYRACLENKDRIDFESLDELLEFENSKKNRISEIHIEARDKAWENTIEIDLCAYSVYVQMFTETVSVSMVTNDIDKKTVFKEKIGTLLERHQQSKRYNLISKTGVLNIIQMIYMVCAVGYLYLFLTKGIKELKSWLAILIIVLGFFSLVLREPLQKCQKKYFPPIAFCLGDGVEEYAENKNGRRNFFWGIIVAGIMSIIFLIAGYFLPQP